MYVEKKRISGKDYYYLKASVRKGDKVTTKTIAYLGKGDKNKEEIEQAVKKHEIKPIRDIGAEPGDIIVIKTKDATEKGILMPSFDENIVFIKLDSGYNLGIEKSKIKSIEKTGKTEPVEFPLNAESFSFGGM